MMWLRREDAAALSAISRRRRPAPDLCALPARCAASPRLHRHELVGSGLLAHPARAPRPGLNPTQERAPNAARFYTETDESRAVALLPRAVRYVLADWELPFRRARRSIAGRFQTVADWAGVTHADYYEIAYRRAQGWTPVWYFTSRTTDHGVSIGALGGTSATPANATTVVAVCQPHDTRVSRFAK